MKTVFRLPAFTLPEALVTMAVLVIFAGIGTTLYFQALSLSARLDRHQKQVEEQVSLATVLPSLCLAIRPPEWAAEEQAFRLTSDGLEARYWDGSPDKALAVRVVSNGLEAITPGAIWRWTSLGPWKIEYWKHSDRIVGLTVRWQQDTVEHSLSIPWGGRPL